MVPYGSGSLGGLPPRNDDRYGCAGPSPILADLRILVAVTLAVAVATIAVAVVAMRSADRSRDLVDRSNARIVQYSAQTAQYRAEILTIERRERDASTTTKAVSALCYSARHATIASGSDYALQIGRSIIRGIANSCDYAKVPDVAGLSAH